MEVMSRVLSDPGLHKSASEGFKKVGQSIGLHGKDDTLICREAAVFWNEETTDNYPSMRPKIDVELAAVAGEFASGGIAWSEHDVQRLITPYPPRPKVDRILENLGQDFYHDHIHGIIDDDGAGDDDALRSLLRAPGAPWLGPPLLRARLAKQKVVVRLRSDALVRAVPTDQVNCLFRVTLATNPRPALARCYLSKTKRRKLLRG